jgi:hypothetical protein
MLAGAAFLAKRCRHLPHYLDRHRHPSFADPHYKRSGPTAKYRFHVIDCNLSRERRRPKAHKPYHRGPTAKSERMIRTGKEFPRDLPPGHPCQPA